MSNWPGRVNADYPQTRGRALFEEMDKFADLAHEAQALFIQALQHISDPTRASVLADEAMKKGLLFSEKLSFAIRRAIFDFTV